MDHDELSKQDIQLLTWTVILLITVTIFASIVLHLIGIGVIKVDLSKRRIEKSHVIVVVSKIGSFSNDSNVGIPNTLISIR